MSYAGGGYGYHGGFALIVVLFILLVIIGASGFASPLMPSGSPPDGFSMKKGLFKTGKKGYNGKQMLFLVDKLMKGV